MLIELLDSNSLFKKVFFELIIVFKQKLLKKEITWFDISWLKLLILMVYNSYKFMFKLSSENLILDDKKLFGNC